jgi:hypothetical protein
MVRCPACLEASLEKIRMLSRKMTTISFNYLLNMLFIAAWNVAGALVSPKGMTRNW